LNLSISNGLLDTCNNHETLTQARSLCLFALATYVIMEGSLPLAGGSDGCDDRNRQARNDRVPGSTNSTVENISITQTPFPITSPLVSDDWHTSLPDTAHVRFFKSVDWTKSVLGPIQSWCVSLRLHTFTLFADSQASCVYW
jgi:hypothetical protein